MRRLTISLFAFFFILTVNAVSSAQDTKPAEQKSPTPASDTEKPKNEVDEMIAEANKHGEKVLGICIDPSLCGEGSITDPLRLERGRVVNLPRPTYSPLARAAHVQGTVVVQVLIDEEGKVVAAAAISGHPLLQSGSVKAAREAVFTPTKLDGAPVKVTGVVQYNFVAQ
jgi:TonB family protein